MVFMSNSINVSFFQEERAFLIKNANYPSIILDFTSQID